MPPLKRLLPAMLLAMAGSAATPAAGAEQRASVWDLTLGTKAGDIPDAYVDYACGTNGGPPARFIAHFRDFADCRAVAGGLHEVYFRYDDEAEYVARALEQAHEIERHKGTRIYGFDVIVSALFNDEGFLQGIRIVTDPRGVEPGDRNDHWRLGDMLRRHFGTEGWQCADEPLGARETPIGSYFIKRACSRSDTDHRFAMRQDYYHGRGESFTDEFGKVMPTYFVSTTVFEMTGKAVQPPMLAAVNPG